jgi:PelA/Pel-15E family pectate lyase
MRAFLAASIVNCLVLLPVMAAPAGESHVKVGARQLVAGDVLDLEMATDPQFNINGKQGVFAGTPAQISGGARRNLAEPQTEPAPKSIALIQRVDKPDPPTIDTGGFRDGAHHWRKIRDPNRVIQPLPDQAAYSPSQVDQIAANILLFQRDNGGWPKDYDLLAVLTPEQTTAVQATRNRTDSSFDNHNIHPQVEYLARAYASAGVKAWRDACLRGFDFMLAAQLESGGFPQRFPDPSGYAAHITINDGVMIGILNVLKDAGDGLPHWTWLDASRRQNARQAVARGIECVLKCQIHARGIRTGWCQQHDEKTYEAASARTFELASCCPQETTEIMRFLMRSEAPSERIVGAVDAAAEWLRRVTLRGIRVKKVPAPVEDFLRHTADFDVVVIEEASAPLVWARHYEIGTDRPIFAGRDAVKRYSLAEIERERRTGTPWYGDWPRTMLDKDYPNWRSKVARFRALPPKSSIVVRTST